MRLALTGPRADTAVEKLVELGVEEIGPLETALKRRETRTDRWQRIAAAAAAQAKRPRVPRIAACVDLPHALAPGAVLLSHEDPDGTFDAALERAGRPLALLVGPESGFAPEEHAAARAAGVPIATLGDIVLRTETAAIAAAVLALDRLGALQLAARTALGGPADGGLVARRAELQAPARQGAPAPRRTSATAWPGRPRAVARAASMAPTQQSMA